MSSSLTLYEISDHLVSLFDSFDLCDTDAQRDACNQEIERYMAAQIRKVDSFCRFLSHLESQSELAEKEIKRLKAREDVFARMQERSEKYAIYVMQRADKRVLEGETSKLILRTNTPGVAVDDEQLVPPEFKTIKQEIQVDKRAVKKALDAGEAVPGTRLKEATVSLLRK